VREEAARAAAELEAAEVELDRRVIAREELVEALAVSAEAAADVEEGEGGWKWRLPLHRCPLRPGGQWCRAGGRGWRCRCCRWTTSRF
jgi:hypothetical protein